MVFANIFLVICDHICNVVVGFKEFTILLKGGFQVLPFLILLICDHICNFLLVFLFSWTLC